MFGHFSRRMFLQLAAALVPQSRFGSGCLPKRSLSDRRFERCRARARTQRRSLVLQTLVRRVNAVRFGG